MINSSSPEETSSTVADELGEHTMRVVLYYRGEVWHHIDAEAYEIVTTLDRPNINYSFDGVNTSMLLIVDPDFNVAPFFGWFAKGDDHTDGSLISIFIKHSFDGEDDDDE